MVINILDALGQISSELDDAITDVEDLPAGESRDKVMGILDVIKEDLGEARKELGKLE
jgi:hypothetical protein